MNDLVDLMREYGVEVHMLGTDEQPNPYGMAIADMLTEIHELRTRPPFNDEHVERLAIDMYNDGEEQVSWDAYDERWKDSLRTLARQRLAAAFGVEGETP